MKAFYLVFFLTLLLSLILPDSTDRQHRWKLFWMFLPLFVFAAIRVDFGGDYPTYELFFDEMHATSGFYLDSEMHMETGFQLLNRFLPSFRSLLVLNAFLLSLALGVFLYHNVPKQYLWLAVILLFLNPEKNIYGSLVGIRNGLVVTSFLLGFVFVQKRKLIPFLLLTALLFTIHRSAILFLPITYFIGQKRPFSKTEIWIWIIAVGFLLTFSMSGLMDIVSMLISNDYLEQYETYLDDSKLHRGVLIVLTNLILLVMLVIPFYRARNRFTPSQNSLIRMGMLYLCTAFLGSLAMRASYFYDMFFIATVTTLISRKETAGYLKIGLPVLAILVSVYSMFVIWMGSPYWNHTVYHSLLGSW